MNLARISRPAVLGILAATTLALAAVSTTVSADDVKVKLSGTMEVPPVSTKAAGTGTISVNKDMMVKGKVKTSGIAPTMAHIHQAAAGSNGPVIVTLTKSDDDTWTVPENTRLTEEQYRAYLAGELYYNVHSEQYPNGEIRGQLMPRKPKTDGK